MLRWSRRLVAAQGAVLALLLAAVHSGPAGWLLAVPAAAALALLGLGRWRGRWLSAWLGDALRYLTRARAMRPPADPAALLRFAWPTAAPGEGPVTIEDAEGVVAVLELGDAAGLLADAGPRLPAPTRLVRAAGPHPPDARVTVQLLVNVAQPAGSGLAAASYRQLTGGAVPVRQRALLAVRLSRVDGGWPGEELRRALPGAVRRLSRRLTRAGFDCRPLDGDDAAAALADLAPLESPAGTGREAWSGLTLGGWSQTCLRAGGVDTLPTEALGWLVPRLLDLPAGLVTFAVSATDGAADLVVRLAGRSASGRDAAGRTDAGLAALTAAAQQQAGAVGLSLRRLDGEQLTGLAGTLPMARPPAAAAATAPAATVPAAALPSPPGPDQPTEPDGVAELAGLPAAGLVLGRNRQGRTVTVRLFGPGPTRAVLLGGVRAAQALVLRALAVGARVTVQTARPHAWEPFLRAVSPPADTVVLLPPGPVSLPAARPLAPQLVVVDVGPVGAATPVPAAAWRASLVLRDEVTGADVELLVHADLVVLQPLTAPEADLVGPALGMAEGREWLSRITGDMIGAVAHPGTGRATLRWALLSPTELERQLIGSTQRVAIG